MRRIWLMVLVVVLIWGIYRHRSLDTGPRVVSQITVEYNTPEVKHIYVDETKMRLILNRLRTLGQRYSPACNPEELEGNQIIITLRFSDGKDQSHQIKQDRYIRSGDQPWQETDPDRLSDLNILLRTLPSDA